ncbi:MAG: hypothetical protein Q9209_002377 [Squamulea sp. 1 TL-2023]
MEHVESSFPLSNLPKEIILDIIENELQDEDLENLALCSKTVYVLASNALAKHLEKKRRYATFSFGDVHLYTPGERSLLARTVQREVHPIFALKNLITNKNVAKYAKMLKIGGVDDQGLIMGAYEDHVTQEAIDLAPNLNPHLEALTRTDSFVQSARARRWINKELKGLHCRLYACKDCRMRFNGLEHYQRHLQTKDHQGRIVYRVAYNIPFVMLQNIEVLELVNCGICSQMFRPMFSAMCQTHPRMREVRFLGDHDGQHQDTWLLFRFAEIPSVRKICGFHIYDVVGRIPGIHPTTSSLIEEIHLECSVISSRIITDFLSCIQALKVFHYDHGSIISDTYRPRYTLQILRQYASESLETLIFVDPHSMYIHTNDKNGGRQSLRNFKVLKHLAIECFFFTTTVFVKERKEDEDVLIVEDVLKVLESRSETKGGPGGDVSRLVDVLPRSLETLELYRPGNKEDITLLLEGLSELREERLPSLQTISIQGDIPVDPRIMEELEGTGIELQRVEAPPKKWSCAT